MGLGKLMGKDALNKSGITGEGRGDYRTARVGKAGPGRAVRGAETGKRGELTARSAADTFGTRW